MIEEIKSILAEEFGYWVRLHKSENDQEEKIKLHGAVCELMEYSRFPEKITTDWLRERYRIADDRVKNTSLKSRELDLIARNRAVKVRAAIKKLGERVSSLDKKTE